MSYGNYYYPGFTLSTSALALLRLTDDLFASQSGDDDTVTLDLPGYKREEITVEATQDGLVTVTAKNERRGEIVRQYYRDGLDPERVEAALTDGVLTLTLKQAEAAKPRKISVK